MLVRVYRVRKPFKSVGIYYPIGKELSEEEFNDQSKLRLAMIKVSEGFLIPLMVEAPEVEAPTPLVESTPVVNKPAAATPARPARPRATTPQVKAK